MRKAVLLVLLVIVGGGVVQEASAWSKVDLPLPQKDGSISIEETLHVRRSVRTYVRVALTMQKISQILWVCNYC